MDKRFWAVIAVIGLIFVGIIVVNNRKGDTDASSNANASTAQATNNVKGDNAKKVTLVEYGDFQCPVCGLYEPTVQEVYNKYKADISLQYRNFPLQQVHQNAFAAARAAEAAGLQGKYWEMHDQLYSLQNNWSASSDPISDFQQYAATIGLKADQFKTDFSSKRVNDNINADIREGTKLNITGTPSFYVNGKAIDLKELVGDDNRPTVEKFSQVIDAAIAKQAKQ